MSLSRACRFKSINDFSLVLDLEKHYQGPVKIQSCEAHIWTEVQSLQSSVVSLKIIQVKCLDNVAKIEPLIILRLTGQNDINHTSFGLDSFTWMFNEEFQFLVKNDFTDKIILDLIDLKECKKKVKQDDPKSIEDFLAAVVNQELADETSSYKSSDRHGKIGQAVIRLNDQNVNEGDKYMELDFGNHLLMVIFNLHCPIKKE